MTLTEIENLHKNILRMSITEFDNWAQKYIVSTDGIHDESYDLGYAEGSRDTQADYGFGDD